MHAVMGADSHLTSSTNIRADERGVGRVRRIRNFIYSLRSESKRIWILFASYSHVSVNSQTPFIRIIRFIFASKYSLRFAYKYSIDAKKYMLQRIFASERIFAEDLLQNFRLKQIFAKL